MQLFKKQHVAVLLIAVVFILSFFFFKRSEVDNETQPQTSARPTKVVTAKAASVFIAPTVEIPGSVISVADSNISSQISGKIVWIANVGDLIKKGDVLARIDDTEAKLELSRRKIDLEKLKKQYEFRSKLYKRHSGLVTKGSVSESYIDELQSNLENAKSDFQHAKTELKRAEEELDRTQIKAPFAGSVVERHVNLGEYAMPGKEMVRLVDIESLEITAQVPSSLVYPMPKGSVLSAEGPNGEKTALLRALVPVGNEISRTMELRATLKESGWLVGTPVKVKIQTSEQKEVVVVPRDALVLRLDQIYVTVVEDNVAKRYPVKTGLSQGELIEVIGDIRKEDVVVIRGAERLRDGDTVTEIELNQS